MERFTEEMIINNKNFSIIYVQFENKKFDKNIIVLCKNRDWKNYIDISIELNKTRKRWDSTESDIIIDHLLFSDKRFTRIEYSEELNGKDKYWDFADYGKYYESHGHDISICEEDMTDIETTYHRDFIEVIKHISNSYIKIVTIKKK